MSGKANVDGTFQLGDGAQFWAYVSPSNETPKNVTAWKVTISSGDWSDTISSDNPQQQLKTPDLSGEFDVTVMAEGPSFDWQELTPQAGSSANIGCNSNCASMVGIVATEDGKGANYWTTWDAMCSQG
jgi:hypothetical protein